MTINPNALLDYICARSWALQQSVLEMLCQVVARVNPKSDAEVAQIVSERNANRRTIPSGFRRDGTLGIIPITGVIAKHASQVNGSSQPKGTSVEQIRNDLEMAMRDEGVQSILLDIDSPGGSVDGLAELADEIFNARATKPIASFTDGLMASAAYWLGSQANTLISTRGAQVGSIGVYNAFIDRSQAFENAGLKVEVIKAGDNKAAGLPGTSLTPTQRAELQTTVDGFREMFVSSIERSRGMERETLDKSADGSTFLGNDAKRRGLVDHVTSAKQAREIARDLGVNPPESEAALATGGIVDASEVFGIRRSGRSEEAFVPVAVVGQTRHVEFITDGVRITDTPAAAAVAADKPSTTPAPPDEGQETSMTENAATEADTVDVDALRAEAVEEERKRVATIRKLAFSGQDALVTELIEDGSDIASAAMRITEDQKKRGGDALAAMETNAPTPSDPRMPSSSAKTARRVARTTTPVLSGTRSPTNSEPTTARSRRSSSSSRTPSSTRMVTSNGRTHSRYADPDLQRLAPRLPQGRRRRRDLPRGTPRGGRER